ncbi:MAG: hypothetical protein HY934_02515 [Candidatus Firestonebacteria bacterium]|nr:hypothetical protein [Candidatus Firestonebacteria bacterium]
MNFIEFKNAFKDFTIFSLQDIRLAAPAFDRKRLTEWQRKGYLKKIVREFYIFSDSKLNENVLFEIANKIYSPSYISFEMALSYYHFIPESVYSITSASTLKTYTFNTSAAKFYYRAIKDDLFFGYDLIKNNNKYVKIASPEKAILDYFYINPDIKSTGDFINMRLNSELFFQKTEEKKFYELLGKFKQKTLQKRIKKFMEFLKND